MDKHPPVYPPPSNQSTPFRPRQKQIRRWSADHENARPGWRPSLLVTSEDDWEQNSPLRSAKSRYFLLPPSYDSETDARTVHAPVSGGIESNTGSPPREPLPGAYILAPRIVATPEYGSVDEGIATVWVAVQLSTQVCQADAPGLQHGKATADSVYSSGEQDTGARTHVCKGF